MRIRYDNIKHTYRWRTWNRWNKPYIYNRNNMHVVCKWCRWRHTIHLRVFAVCHTYKISQMSVQSQRASSPIRGTGNILTHENTKGRGIQFHSGYWKKHNEHGDSVCELLKHIFSYRNLSRVWTSIQTIPNSKWLPSWRRCHLPKFWPPYVFHWSTVLALRYTVWSPCI